MLSSSSSSTSNDSRFGSVWFGRKYEVSVRFTFEKKFLSSVRVRFDLKNQGSNPSLIYSHNIHIIVVMIPIKCVTTQLDNKDNNRFQTFSTIFV